MAKTNGAALENAVLSSSVKCGGKIVRLSFRRVFEAGCCVFLVLSFAVKAQGGENSSTTESSPSSVIREYCKLDLRGTRLSSNNPDIEKYFALVAWPNEPGWDDAVVVKSFAIARSRVWKSQSSVTAKYFVLGQITGATVVVSPQHTESVTFLLTRNGSTWKIEHPLIPPHISPHSAIVAFERLLKEEHDPARRRRLRAGIAVLARWEQTRGRDTPH